ERRFRAERSTGKRAAATRRLRQAEKYLYGGRLSRAVRAEEAEDAVLHRQRKVVECDDLRVALGDVLEADRPVRDRHLPHGVRYRKCLALRERPAHLEHHAVLLPDDGARDGSVVADVEALAALHRSRVPW